MRIVARHPLMLLLGITAAGCAPSTSPHVNATTAATAAQTRSVSRIAPRPGGLAIDRAGNVYVASADLSAWDARGRPRPFRFASAKSPGPLAIDEQYLYCADAAGIRRFRLDTGMPVAFTGPAASIAIDPSAVRAMDVAASTLYVADAATGEIRMFDSETGQARGSFSAPLPTAVAVDAIGQIWVAHDRGAIRAFRADGYAGVIYAGPPTVAALAFGPGAKLYVADAATGHVLSPAGAGATETFTTALDPTLPGRLLRLDAIAVDDKDNIVTLQRDLATSRSRVAKWSPDRRLLWEVTESVNAPATPP